MSNWDDPLTQTRLSIEAKTTDLGYLVETQNAPGTDVARVEVSWEDAAGRPHAGFFIVDVTSDPEDEDWHPATAARLLAEARLEQMAEDNGWTYCSVDDVYAY